MSESCKDHLVTSNQLQETEASTNSNGADSQNMLQDAQSSSGKRGIPGRPRGKGYSSRSYYQNESFDEGSTQGRQKRENYDRGYYRNTDQNRMSGSSQPYQDHGSFQRRPEDTRSRGNTDSYNVRGTNGGYEGYYAHGNSRPSNGSYEQGSYHEKKQPKRRPNVTEVIAHPTAASAYPGAANGDFPYDYEQSSYPEKKQTKRKPNVTEVAHPSAASAYLGGANGDFPYDYEQSSYHEKKQTKRHPNVTEVAHPSAASAYLGGANGNFPYDYEQSSYHEKKQTKRKPNITEVAHPSAASAYLGGAKGEVPYDSSAGSGNVYSMETRGRDFPKRGSEHPRSRAYDQHPSTRNGSQSQQSFPQRDFYDRKQPGSRMYDKPGFRQDKGRNYDYGEDQHGQTGHGNVKQFPSRRNVPTESSTELVSAMHQTSLDSREPDSAKNKPIPKRQANIKIVKSADFDQREKLTEQLSNGRYECMVCCDRVKQVDAIWSCNSCFNVFHIVCVKKWARTAVSQGEEGWRCPACQTVTQDLPSGYYCFCGKVREPQWNRRDVPHSCGEVCLRPLSKDSDNVCTHKCNILCHPGPCPTCTSQVKRTCPCGKTIKTVKCNTSLEAGFCNMQCSKLLNCEKHECPSLCHSGKCETCEITYEISCFCEKDTKVIPCEKGVDKNTRFSCENKCSKLLSCGNHKCELKCHPGNCMDCPYKPEIITSCPCGKTSLEKLYDLDEVSPRKSCLDPIPTCGKMCGRELECGPPEMRHVCEAECHLGPCPDCPKTTEIRCRCGKNEIGISCKEYRKDSLVLCERKCNKKRHCGRHKCLQMCCIDVDHICTMVCGRLLSCRNHKCEELCHTGPCKPCLRASFEELTCHCGTTVTYPPVPCGTRAPECSRPCTRPRSCPHPPNHNCHSDSDCPPCTALTERWCYGRHESRKNVACHVTGLSCGHPCGKPLGCGRHSCIRICHDGECASREQKCTQPCPIPRSTCGHPCGSPCHEGDCPETSCREKVTVLCECGNRKAVVSCEDQQSAYRKIATEHLFSKMSEMNAGQTISLDSVLGSGKKDKSRSLKCDEECAQIDRNRRLALALQIRNPDLVAKPGPPTYTSAMKEWVRKDPKFIQMVHSKLTELVQLAKQSKQKSRQYSFPVMNRDKRQLVHEYSEFFGCESQAFDEEPNRNVVATAYGDRSWLPSQSLTDVFMRDNGQRKIPQPIGGMGTSKKPTLSAWGVPSAQGSSTPSSAGANYTKLSDVVRGDKSSNVVDYFDMTE